MKKKILIVCGSYFAYEKFLKEINNYYSFKYDIDIIIGEKNKKTNSNNNFYYINIPNNFLDFFKKFIFCSIQIRNIIKNKNYSAVIHNNRNSSICSRLALFFLSNKIKSIYFARGMYFHDNQNIISKFLSYIIEIFFLIRTDLILSQTREDLKKLLFFTNFFNVKAKYIGNGVRFYKQFISVDNFDFYHFISICRITPGKGIEHLLYAFNNIKKKINSKLTIIGGPRTISDKKYLNYLKKNYNFDKIKITGITNNVRNLAKEGNIYIQSSLREGLSRSLLEAMSQGLIPIASNVRGNREVIINKKNGIIYKFNDKKDLENQIINLVNLPIKLKKNIKHNAINTIKKKYLVKKYLDLQLKYISNI